MPDQFITIVAKHYMLQKELAKTDPHEAEKYERLTQRANQWGGNTPDQVIEEYYRQLEMEEQLNSTQSEYIEKE